MRWPTTERDPIMAHSRISLALVLAVCFAIACGGESSSASKNASAGEAGESGGGSAGERVSSSDGGTVQERGGRSSGGSTSGGAPGVGGKAAGGAGGLSVAGSALGGSTGGTPAAGGTHTGTADCPYGTSVASGSCEWLMYNVSLDLYERINSVSILKDDQQAEALACCASETRLPATCRADFLACTGMPEALIEPDS
jgi:hypothetical protein